MTTLTDDNQPIRGHTYRCDECGCDGACCDTSAGGVVLDGTEQFLALGGREVLLAGTASGKRTDEWLCEDCADCADDTN